MSQTNEQQPEAAVSMSPSTTPPVPPTPYRLGDWAWSPITTSRVALIFFDKQEPKRTSHALGTLSLKDYFSHPDNPDFEPYCNMSELDYETVGQRFITAINEYDSNKAKIEKLEAALAEIANHPHCSYDHPSNQGGSIGYGTGIVDGHRCAAAIARAAIESTKEKV
jgi:hypothetical protein